MKLFFVLPQGNPDFRWSVRGHARLPRKNPKDLEQILGSRVQEPRFLFAWDQAVELIKWVPPRERCRLAG